MRHGFLWRLLEAGICERPSPRELRRLLFSDRNVRVAEVLARWRTPQGQGFRLRGDDGALYVLVQDESSGRWTAEIDDSPGNSNSR